MKHCNNDGKDYDKARIERTINLLGEKWIHSRLNEVNGDIEKLRSIRHGSAVPLDDSDGSRLFDLIQEQARLNEQLSILENTTENLPHPKAA